MPWIGTRYVLCIIEFPFLFLHFSQKIIDAILSHPVAHILLTIAQFRATQRLAAAAAPAAAGMCGITTNQSAFDSLIPKCSYALPFFVL